MKSFENQSFDINGHNKDYVGLCIDVLNNPGQNGLTPLQQVERVRVISRLQDIEGDKISLEDSDFNVLKSALDDMRFGIVDENIASFCSTILEM